MSQANIPNITPIISITLGGAVNLLLASIALEELALAHIVNAEAEKIQYVLGTLTPLSPPIAPTISNILLINESVRKTLQDVIKKCFCNLKWTPLWSTFPIRLHKINPVSFL